METGETPSLGPSRCSARLFLSFALRLANLYESAITKMCRRRQMFTSLVCLSSLVSLSFMSVTFSSSSKPLLSHFIDLSTFRTRTHDVRNVHKIWIACQSYFIVLTIRTRDVQNHDRLVWFVNRNLSFSQSVHAMYKTITDYCQCGAFSGLPQLVGMVLKLKCVIETE